jgi:hypothetical protein
MVGPAVAFQEIGVSILRPGIFVVEYSCSFWAARVGCPKSSWDTASEGPILREIETYIRLISLLSGCHNIAMSKKNCGMPSRNPPGKEGLPAVSIPAKASMTSLSNVKSRLLNCETKLPQTCRSGQRGSRPYRPTRSVRRKLLLPCKSSSRSVSSDHSPSQHTHETNPSKRINRLEKRDSCRVQPREFQIESSLKLALGLFNTRDPDGRRILWMDRSRLLLQRRVGRGQHFVLRRRLE